MTKKATGRRLSGRPSVQDSSRVDQAILTGALATFERRGFSAASMKEIAELAGTTRQTVYARFKDKAALYQALVDNRIKTLLDDLFVVLDAEEEPSSALRLFGDRLLSAFIGSDLQRLNRMAITESRVFPELAKTFFEIGPGRGQELLRRYLAAQVHKGKLQIGNVEFASGQFLGSILGSIILRSTLHQPQLVISAEAQQEWVRLAVEMFLSAYATSDARSDRETMNP